MHLSSAADSFPRPSFLTKLGLRGIEGLLGSRAELRWLIRLDAMRSGFPGRPVWLILQEIDRRRGSMDSEAIRRAALTIRSYWENRRRMTALPEDCRPKRLRDGYEIQRALESLQGATIGWKIAATSKAGQQHIGVDAPLAGRLFKRFAHIDGARLPAAHLHMRVAEAEFAFKMAEDLPARGEPYSQDEVMDAVDTLHLAIEVPDSRYEDFATIGAASLVADDSCAAYFILGPEAKIWKLADLPTHKVTAHKNGELVAEG